MKYGDLPIGSKILFGRYRENDRGQEKELKWTKVTDDCRTVLVPRQIVAVFDHCERGVNQDRMNHGYNFYPYSNIDQYLNSRNYEWFVPKHSGDTVYYHEARRPGFLHFFMPEEIKQIAIQHITVASPKGSKKEFGEKTEIDRLVTIPSASQFGWGGVNDIQREEGERIDLLSDSTVFHGVTRTGSTDSCHILARDWRSLRPQFCSGYDTVCPMIILSPNVEVVQTAENGMTLYVADIKSEIEKRLASRSFVDLVLN
ncbi:MAG: hypothetical protein IJV14_10755 [Lachnospiraceae bacterium]|nr:hypothetical protein [Lachnospiraceae bacterium]